MDVHHPRQPEGMRDLPGPWHGRDRKAQGVLLESNRSPLPPVPPLIVVEVRLAGQNWTKPAMANSLTHMDAISPTRSRQIQQTVAKALSRGPG